MMRVRRWAQSTAPANRPRTMLMMRRIADDVFSLFRSGSSVADSSENVSPAGGPAPASPSLRVLVAIGAADRPARAFVGTSGDDSRDRRGSAADRLAADAAAAQSGAGVSTGKSAASSPAADGRGDGRHRSARSRYSGWIAGLAVAGGGWPARTARSAAAAIDALHLGSDHRLGINGVGL